MCLINTFLQSHNAVGISWFGVAMRTYDMNDVQSPYEHEEDSMGENVQVGNAETESNGRRNQDTPQILQPS